MLGELISIFARHTLDSHRNYLLQRRMGLFLKMLSSATCAILCSILVAGIAAWRSHTSQVGAYASAAGWRRFLSSDPAADFRRLGHKLAGPSLRMTPRPE